MTSIMRCHLAKFLRRVAARIDPNRVVSTRVLINGVPFKDYVDGIASSGAGMKNIEAGRAYARAKYGTHHE